MNQTLVLQGFYHFCGLNSGITGQHRSAEKSLYPPGANGSRNFGWASWEYQFRFSSDFLFVSVRIRPNEACIPCANKPLPASGPNINSSTGSGYGTPLDYPTI